MKVTTTQTTTKKTSIEISAEDVEIMITKELAKRGYEWNKIDVEFDAIGNHFRGVNVRLESEETIGVDPG